MEKNLVNVVVPCGITKEQYCDIPSVTAVSKFSLTPRINEDWVTKIINNQGKTVALDGFNIEFESPTKEFKELELIQRSILIVDFDEVCANDSSKSGWKFVGDGILIPDPSGEKAFTLSSKISEDGKKLYVLIDKVGDTGSSHGQIKYVDVSFLFVASYTDRTGQETVYLSQDPSVGIGRTIGN